MTVVGKDRTSRREESQVAGDCHGDRSQPTQLGLPLGEPVSSGDPAVGRSGGSVLSDDESRPVRVDGLWEEVFSPRNLERALQRVESNRGAPGVDEMTTDVLRGWWSVHAGVVLGSLEEGRFRPSPVRRVVVPKPGGGSRMLGVPTVVDRLVQQAVAQVLTPIFDAGFSEHSYGFRPGRSAHGAVEQAREFLDDGFRWVVDVDLDAFFDRVNHDKLMHRVWRRVADKRLLRLIRAFLEAGIMVDGVRQPVEEGTPQGSPLSPLLSNIMLDDLDRELERRGHRFVRYADDLRVFVGSERAARRVLDGITVFVEGRLKLRVNRAKSSIGPMTVAMLLGFGFYVTGEGVMIRVAPAALRRVKDRIRRLTRRQSGRSMSTVIDRLNRFIAGWAAYFRIAHTGSVFTGLDGWLRRRLRALQWTLWKTPQRRVTALRQAGVNPRYAFQAAHSRRGAWRVALYGAVTSALSNRHWQHQGLVGFYHHWNRLRNP